MTSFSDRLFGSILNGDQAAAVTMFAEESAFLMSSDSYVIALHSAATNGYVQLAFTLLMFMNSKSINACDGLGRNALHIASQFRRVKIAAMLLEKMSEENINARSKSPSGRTALHEAAANGDLEMVQILIPVMTKDAIESIDGAGWTALMHASGHGSTEIVELLLEKMSQKSIDTHDGSNVTALHLSGGKRCKKIVEMLLSKMSHQAINMKTKFGRHISDYPGMGGLTYVDHAGETRFTS